MSLIGDSKEEDREIFKALKTEAKERREQRASRAAEHLERVRLLVDNGLITIDPNGTWNWKLKGRAGQYWPTKGRWQYTSAKLLKKARQQAWRDGHPTAIRYAVKDTLFGGGIFKFIDWLQKEQ